MTAARIRIPAERRPLVILALGMAIFIAALTVMPRLASLRAGDAPSRELVAWEDRSTVPHHGVAFLAALPTCTEDPSFDVWASGALAAHGKPVVGVFAPAGLEAVGAETPLLRLPGVAACFAGRKSAQASGWYMLDGGGNLLARGVSTSDADPGVPRQVVVAGGQAQTYIQERIGSGQFMAGAVIGDSVVGKLAKRLVVVDVAGWAPEGEGAVLADTVRQALSLTKLDIPWEAAFLPRRVPAGFDACAVQRVLPGLPGGAAYRVTEFCDADGATIFTGLFDPSEDADSGMPESGITVAGRGGKAYEARGRRGVRVAPEANAMRFHWVEGPGGMAMEDLRRILESLPIVAQPPSSGNPSSGEPEHGSGEEEGEDHGLPDGVPSGPLPAGPPAYTVQSGDSLWSIAEAMYGDGRYWVLIRDANKISDANPLRLGLELAIPRTSLPLGGK